MVELNSCVGEHTVKQIPVKTLQTTVVALLIIWIKKKENNFKINLVDVRYFVKFTYSLSMTWNILDFLGMQKQILV